MSVAEPVEQMPRVVRARRGLGVVLHGERRPRPRQRRPSRVLVVQVPMGERRRPGARPYGLGSVGPRPTAAEPPHPSGSTAKPWLWLVISTRPVARSSTGWFTPRCPNRSL